MFRNNDALKYLFLTNALFTFGGSLLGPLYAVLVQHIKGDVLSISISWAVFLLSTTFCGLIVSRIGDRVKKKRSLLVAGYFIRSVVWFLYIFVTNMEELFILQVFLGIGESLGSPTFNTLFAEHLDKNKHLREYADWTVIGTIITALGTVAGGFIVEKYGFTILFAIMGTLAFLSAVITQRKLRT